MLVNVGFVVLTMKLDSPHALRYMMPLLIYPPLMVLWRLTTDSATRLCAGLVVVLVTLATLLGVRLVTRSSDAVDQGSTPAAIACLDRVVQREGLRLGLADYWNARYVTMLSTKGVQVNAFQENLFPYNWIVHLNAFGEPFDRGQAYDFALLGHTPPPRGRLGSRESRAMLRRRLGPVPKTIQCPRFEVWVLDQRRLQTRHVATASVFAQAHHGATPRDYASPPAGWERYSREGKPVGEAPFVAPEEGETLSLLAPRMVQGAEVSWAGRGLEVELLYRGQVMAKHTLKATRSEGKLEVEVIPLRAPLTDAIRVRQTGGRAHVGHVVLLPMVKGERLGLD